MTPQPIVPRHDHRHERSELGLELTRALKVDLYSIGQEQHISGHTFSFIVEILGKLAQLFKVTFEADLFLLPDSYLTRLTSHVRKYNGSFIESKVSGRYHRTTSKRP